MNQLKKSLHYFVKYQAIIYIGIVFWCILNEAFTVRRLFEGIVVGGFTAFFIHILLGENNHYATTKNLGFFRYIHYGFTLIFAIAKSTIYVLRLILFEDTNPTFVQVNSTIEDEWPRCIIANSITLTPGTITIDDNGKYFIVLWVKPTTTHLNEVSATIQGTFEHVFSTDRKDK